MVNEVRARLADKQLHGVIGTNNSLAEAGRTPTKSMIIGTPTDRLLGVCVSRLDGGRVLVLQWMTRGIAMAVSPIAACGSPFQATGVTSSLLVINDTGDIHCPCF